MKTYYEYKHQGFHFSITPCINGLWKLHLITPIGNQLCLVAVAPKKNLVKSVMDSFTADDIKKLDKAEFGQGLPSIEVLTFKQVLKIEHEAVMAILNKSSSRMRYRRENLESLFKGLGLKVKFTTADMKEAIKTL